MSSIDPTIRLAETRSYIDLLQAEIANLETMMSDYIEMKRTAQETARQNGTATTAATAADTADSRRDITADFRDWQEARHELTPRESRDFLKDLAYDAGLIRDQAHAWVDFSASSQSEAVTRQAITVLRASLGAARQEESYWNKEQEEQQKMQKSSNEIAKL